MKHQAAATKPDSAHIGQSKEKQPFTVFMCRDDLLTLNMDPKYIYIHYKI